MDLIGFLYGFGLLHGVILAGVLLYIRSDHRLANAFMAGLVACIALRFLSNWLIRTGVFMRYPDLSLVIMPLDFAWGPLLSGLQQREEFIRRSLKEARDDREAAEARLQEYEEKLSGAGAEVSQIVEQGKREGENLRASIEEKAHDEADKMVERARREIEIAKQSAIKDLYATSSELATEIASRILQRELNAQDHEKLISDSIKELGSLDRN